MKIKYRSRFGMREFEPSLTNENGNLRGGGLSYEWENALRVVADWNDNHRILNYKQALESLETQLSELEDGEDDSYIQEQLSHIHRLYGLLVTDPSQRDVFFFMSESDDFLTAPYAQAPDIEEACRRHLLYTFEVEVRYV